MSLKTYINDQVQAFRKKGNADIIFGIQGSSSFKMLPIFEAYESGTTDDPTEITAVKISNSLPFTELDRISLATDLISFSDGQYLVDLTKSFANLLNEGIYYIEFKNGINVFSTEAFLVQKTEYPLTVDFTVITCDSTLITIDTSKIEI